MNPMSWLVAYFAIATVGVIVVLAMFKVGSDADARVPLIPPDDHHRKRAEAATAVALSLDSPRLAKDDASIALPVVEAGSIDLSRRTDKDDTLTEVPSSSCQ
jgi:hypothetical protein